MRVPELHALNDFHPYRGNAGPCETRKFLLQNGAQIEEE
jgi:hypothetical protein